MQLSLVHTFPVGTGFEYNPVGLPLSIHEVPQHVDLIRGAAAGNVNISHDPFTPDPCAQSQLPDQVFHRRQRRAWSGCR